MLRLTLSLISLVAVVLFATPAFADAKADHAALSDSAAKLSTSAATLAKAAKASDDRGARKKFAPAAQDLSDDLAAFSRRAAKDQPFKSLAADATAVLKDSSALVELADEAEDKEERKSLRSQAVLIQQGVANLGKALIAAAAAEEKGGATPATAKKFTGRLFNTTDKCNWPENVKFQVSRNGTVVFTSQMVFDGRNIGLVLDEGQYLVQMFETNNDFLAQKTLDVKAEGWQFVSGCVKD